MATNPPSGDGHRNGMVRQRSQVLNPKTGIWTKRGPNGQFMDGKQDGTPFTKLVLDAYENNVITATQAMRYLDTSLDNINKLDLNING